MADENAKPSSHFPSSEAARMLGVDEAALQALIKAGFVNTNDAGEVTRAEIKAFAARNADGGSVTNINASADTEDFEALIDELDEACEELARKAYEEFAAAVPEAQQWSANQRDNFLKQAQGRLGAVLAVTSHGAQVDDALRRDLEQVGSGAARAGSSLVHLQMVLRISRDLLLQRAMDLADERQGRWNAILSAFASRLSPSIDRLTDAISHGYWTELLERHSEAHHRLSALIDNVPYGVYEADLDGMLHHVNPYFASILGKQRDELEGTALTEALVSLDNPDVASRLLSEPEGDAGQVTFDITDGTGQRVTLDIDTVVRRRDGEAAGFAGIIRLHTDASLPDMSGLAHHSAELRRSLEILVEAGSFLHRHADAMDANQLRQAGDSLKQQAQRLIRIVDELDKDRQALEA